MEQLQEYLCWLFCLCPAQFCHCCQDCGKRIFVLFFSLKDVQDPAAPQTAHIVVVVMFYLYVA